MCPENTSNVLYGRLSQLDKEKTSWGEQSVMFSHWSEMDLKGLHLKLEEEIKYGDLYGGDLESILLVEEGRGILRHQAREHTVEKGYAVKIFPDENPGIIPDGQLSLTCIQKPVKPEEAARYPEDIEKVSVVNPEAVTSMVYEYETLGQEIFTCNYKNGLGLIKFVFPIDKIPLHQHPFAGRLIRTIWGRGYTYVEPEKYEMNSDTFALFPKAVTHTNGPDPGNIYVVWAVQLPWIEPEIDSDNIAGSEAFVKYVGPQIPRELWKTKEDFLRAIKKMSEH
ncbi:MAG: hypothetical protein MI863_13295 [Desulfobacterales bacterium]|nr:hypothetical protein [Desulfobacterales bacterium]